MHKRTVRGVGYDTGGEYQRTTSGELIHAYITWSDMFRRCYDAKYHLRRPSYSQCTVAECWHDFQVFAAWYYNHPHYGLGYQLDKDILVRGNTVYSPETCALVPRVLNMAITGGRVKGLPQGVIRNHGSYTARIARFGKGAQYLGTFKTIEEAATCYRIAKEQYIRSLAQEYKHDLEYAVYVQLCNWTLVEDSDGDS